MFNTDETLLVEQKMGIANARNPSFTGYIISNSVKALLNAKRAFTVSMDMKKELAEEIVKMYPSMRDINNSSVFLNDFMVDLYYKRKLFSKWSQITLKMV